MPSYVIDKDGNSYKDDKTITVVSNSVTEGISDVLVDRISVVENNVANIDLTGKQDKLTAGTNIEITDNIINAIIDVDKAYVDEQISTINTQLDNKLTKVTTSGKPRLYGIGTDGTQFTINFDKEALGGSIAQRNGSGTLHVTDPEFDNEAATKKYVDSGLNAEIERATTNEQLIDNKLNADVTTDVSSSISGDTIVFNIDKKNLNNGNISQSTTSIEAATQSTPGLMTAADVKTLSDLNSRVESLEGKTTRLLYTTSTIPTAEQINTFVTELGYQTPFEGIAVIIAGTYHIWHYYSNDNIGWRDDGQDTVSNFTNEVPGLIKGANQVDGKVYAETDGTGSVYGWDALKAQVEKNKNNLANKADVSSLNSKLDSVTSVTPVNQAYVKKADGTQTVENIYASAEPNSIAYRDESGRLKAADGDADDDVITKGQYNTYIAAAVSGLERADNKVSVIEGEGSDVQYPSTKALVNYVAAIEPYHITVENYTGTVTQEQYDKLKANNNSYVYIKKADAIATKVINWTTGLYYNAAVGVRQYEMYIRTDLEYTVNLIDLEQQDNKVTAITGTGTDIQYPSTKAVVDYGQTIQTNAQTYANTAETNAKAYADSLIGNVNEWLTKIDSGEGV